MSDNNSSSVSSPYCSPPYQGSCLCGQVRYSVDQIDERMGHCHCSMCRKFHGAAFATFGETTQAHFRWLTGEEYLVVYKADNATERTFCSVCGSSLIFKAPSMPDDIVEFSLGTLDSDIPHRPDVHIFMGSKACWYEADQKLPQFSEGRNNPAMDTESGER